MKTKTKIIFGGLVTIGLVAILAIVGLGYLWEYLGTQLRSPEIRAKNDKGIADGIAFGKTTDQNGCIEKGFLLKPKDSIYDLSKDYFLENCLKESRRVPNFCDGVPVISGGNWEIEECKRIGRNTYECFWVMDEKHIYCRSADAKK